MQLVRVECLVGWLLAAVGAARGYAAKLLVWGVDTSYRKLTAQNN